MEKTIFKKMVVNGKGEDGDGTDGVDGEVSKQPMVVNGGVVEEDDDDDDDGVVGEDGEEGVDV